MTSQVDDDKLNTLKSEIRCILLSKKEGIGIQGFLSDYKLLVGKNIPVSQFGYKNIIELLNALPDTVKISKPYGEHEVLLPVVHESTAHINKLVSGQKVTSKKGSARKPRPFQLPVDDRRLPPPSRAPRRAPPGFSAEPLLPLPSSRGWENRNYMPPQNIFHKYPPLNQYQLSPHWMTGKSLIPLMDSYNNGQYHQHQQNNSPCIPYPQPPMTSNPNQTRARNTPTIPQTVQCDQPQKQPSPDIVQGATNENEIDESKGTNDVSSKLVSYHSSEEDEVEQITSMNCNQNNVSQSESCIEELEKDEPEEDFNSTLSDVDDSDSTSSFSDRIKENFRLILKEHPNGILSTKFSQLYTQKYNVSLSQFDFGFRSVHEMAMALPNIFTVHPSKTAKGSSDWLLFDASSKAAAEDSSKWIPRQVIENMQELASIYPNGIASNDIAATYKHKFKVPLDVKKLGFENITSFLMNCPSILYSVQDGQSLIFPVNWGKEDGTEEEPDVLGLPVEHVEFLWKGLFLPFVCNPRYKFSKFELPESSSMKIIVADALSPELIWLQKVESSGHLKELMDDMNLFYEEQGNEFLMTESMVVPSLACATKFSGQWHRALICQPRDGDIKVLYIDYGTTGYVKLKDVRTLHEKYCDLPIQAVRAKLYGISPINEIGGWSNDAVQDLFSLCLNNVFIAEIVKRKPEIPSVEIVLYDTDGPEDVIINRLLIFKGHARAENELFKSTENPFPSKSIVSKDELPHVNIPSEKDFNLYPNLFLNLLPVWLNVTNNWDDVNKVFRQAKDNCNDSSCGQFKNPSNPPSCCAHHLFTYMFVNAPLDFCEAWGETIKSFGDKFERQFLKSLSDRLNTTVAWKNNFKLCLSGDEYKTPTFEVQDLVYPYETQDKSQYTNPYESLLNSTNFDYSPRNSDNAFNASFEDGSYALNGINQDYRRSSFDTMSLRSMDSSIIGSTEHLTMDPNGFHIIEKNVLDQVFHFIYSNNEIYMLRDELFKILAPYSSIEMFKMKLRVLKPSLCKWVSIGPKVNKPIYNELIRKGVIRLNERVSALPLSIVASFILAIRPNYNVYARKFREMADLFEREDFQAFLDADDRK